MTTVDLTWLFPFYVQTFDWDRKHFWLPSWYEHGGFWTVRVLDVSRDILVQLPLFLVE